MAGQLKVTADDYPYNYGPPTYTLIPYINFDLSGKHRLRKTVRFSWHLLGITNPQTKYGPEKLYGDIPEFNLEWRALRNAKLRLGMNTLNWGVVDIYSPSDVVNTTAMFHPLRSIKHGAPMVEALLGPESANFHFVYIPIQQTPTLPSRDSRWLPREILFDTSFDGARIHLPHNLDYTIDRTEEYEHALQNNYGVKFASHLGSFDFQLMHFEGAMTSPKIGANVNASLGSTMSDIIAKSPIELKPLITRVRTSGLGLTWAREKWIFRAESAYQHTLTKGDIFQPWMWTSVAEVETSRELGSTTMTIIGQYYYTTNPQTPDNLISSAFRLFDRTGILGFRWAWSDNLTIMGSGLFESNTNGIFWMGGFEQRLSDSLRWSLGWRDFSAQKDGLLKTYQRNDHATLELSYFF